MKLPIPGDSHRKCFPALVAEAEQFAERVGFSYVLVESNHYPYFSPARHLTQSREDVFESGHGHECDGKIGAFCAPQLGGQSVLQGVRAAICYKLVLQSRTDGHECYSTTTCDCDEVGTGQPNAERVRRYLNTASRSDTSIHCFALSVARGR